jgi:hypothetical protein
MEEHLPPTELGWQRQLTRKAKAAAMEAVERLERERRLLQAWRESHPEIPVFVEETIRNAELDREQILQFWRMAAK